MDHAISPRYGFAWPAHHADIVNKGLTDFALVTSSMRMPARSGILLDVKYMSGRTFFPTKVRALRSLATPAGYSGLSESIYYASRNGHELFLGVPVLHDTALAQTDLAMINAEGGKDENFLCPANPGVAPIIVELLNELAGVAPDAKLFLPFFRYPLKRRVIESANGFSITRGQAYCFCPHCRKGFKARFGYELSWKSIIRHPSCFHDWLAWRCHTIEELARQLVRQVPRQLVVEIDLCPKRFFLDGILVDNGHDLPVLSEIFGHVLVHAFDRSSPFAPFAPTVDASNDIMFMNIERIKRRAKVYLMMWNIDVEADFQRSFEYANSVDVEIRFFVLYPPMMPWLLDRIAGHA